MRSSCAGVAQFGRASGCHPEGQGFKSPHPLQNILPEVIMNDRAMYPFLPEDVSIKHCSKDSPMPLEIASQVIALKQLWIHDDAVETEESIERGDDLACFRCPNCGHVFTVLL